MGEIPPYLAQKSFVVLCFATYIEVGDGGGARDRDKIYN